MPGVGVWCLGFLCVNSDALSQVAAVTLFFMEHFLIGLWKNRGNQFARKDLRALCTPIRPTAPWQAREGGAEMQDLHKTKEWVENRTGKVLLVNAHHSAREVAS